MITCKSTRELEKMRRSARVTADALERLRTAVAPGVTTAEIDTYAEELIRGAGGVPAFLGYHGFRGSVCTSVNDEIVHGIPGRRKLQEGDLFKIDIGSCVDGWYSDMACTIAVGRVSQEAQHLIDGLENLSTDADHIAEIDDAITGLQALGETIVERGEPVRLAVNRCDGPNPTGPSQYCIDWRVAGS